VGVRRVAVREAHKETGMIRYTAFDGFQYAFPGNLLARVCPAPRIEEADLNDFVEAQPLFVEGCAPGFQSIDRLAGNSVQVRFIQWGVNFGHVGTPSQT
jgi:hypothetical protein